MVVRPKISFIKHWSLWATLLAFVILHIGSRISLLTIHDLGVSDFYLPSTLSIVLLYLLGLWPVVIAIFVNSVITSPLWGNSPAEWPLWFLYAIPEALYPLTSWFLFKKLYGGKFWLPDIRNTVLFLVVGVGVPALIEVFLLQTMLLWTGAQAAATYWKYIASNLLSEFALTFFLALPVLYYATPWLKKRNWLPAVSDEISDVPALDKPALTEMLLVFLVLIFCTFFIDFREFWFFYGIISLYVAIRLGFGPAIITNFYILLLIYVLPKMLNGLGKNDVGNYLDVMNIFLGASLLSVFAAITGRVMSDFIIADEKLKKKNVELEKTNEELDHYVYSVSHDLSAPLKSILGLVYISRLTKDRHEHLSYLDRIERSVKKLEAFIAEILDYSRNKRQKLVRELVNLKDLCEGILGNLLDNPERKHVQVDFQLEEPEIYQDKTRLKIILNNLLSNAVRFQKNFDESTHLIRIASYKDGDNITIKIEDNGEGIRQEQFDSIFKMFYRGHMKSEGSGLGLYIAKEAVSKIKGSITVASEYGKGSTFMVHLKDLKNMAG